MDKNIREHHIFKLEQEAIWHCPFTFHRLLGRPSEMETDHI